MAETITLEISETIARRARQIAARSQRRVEDVLVEWLARAASDPALDPRSDEDLLPPGDVQMPNEAQEDLDALLSLEGENSQDPNLDARLEQLMSAYRRGLF